jgi:hypothetical protein
LQRRFGRVLYRRPTIQPERDFINAVRGGKRHKKNAVEKSHCRGAAMDLSLHK